MTWLAGLPEGTTDWQRITAVKPAAFAALADLYRAGWGAADPITLELCRLRIANLFGYGRANRYRSAAALDAGLDEAKVADLPRWPHSPRYSERERACLAFAEQFVIDLRGVGDELVDGLLEHLSPERCYWFVRALWAVEAMERLSAVLGMDPDPAALGLVERRQAAVAGRR